MTWIVKVLNRDFQKVRSIWDGSKWVETNEGVADFVINDFQFSESTWREVSFEVKEDSNIINRESLSTNKILTEASPRYQILNPLIEEIYITLPSPPQFNSRYIIKNNSEVGNKLLVREVKNGPVIFTLDSLDEFATLFHDSVSWQIRL